jgi:hypothetical protein
MKCDSLASHLAYTFASLCLGYKPKARVVTKWLGGAKKNLLIDIPTRWNQFQNTFTLKQVCFMMFCFSFGLHCI